MCSAGRSEPQTGEENQQALKHPAKACEFWLFMGFVKNKKIYKIADLNFQTECKEKENLTYS